jgi:hypothetical protein
MDSTLMILTLRDNGSPPPFSEHCSFKGGIYLLVRYTSDAVSTCVKPPDVRRIMQMQLSAQFTSCKPCKTARQLLQDLMYGLIRS